MKHGSSSQESPCIALRDRLNNLHPHQATTRIARIFANDPLIFEADLCKKLNVTPATLKQTGSKAKKHFHDVGIVLFRLAKNDRHGACWGIAIVPVIECAA